MSAIPSQTFFILPGLYCPSSSGIVFCSVFKVKFGTLVNSSSSSTHVGGTFGVGGDVFVLEYLVEVDFKQMLQFLAVEKRPLAERLDPGFCFCKSWGVV